MHNVVHLLGSWEALVHEHEIVVVESLVSLEVVFLVVEELIDLDEPGTVQGIDILQRDKRLMS